MNNSWRQRELAFLLLYAVIFYVIVIRYSLQLSHGTLFLSLSLELLLLYSCIPNSFLMWHIDITDHYNKLYGLRPGLISTQLNVCFLSWSILIYSIWIDKIFVSTSFFCRMLLMHNGEISAEICPFWLLFLELLHWLRTYWGHAII